MQNFIDKALNVMATPVFLGTIFGALVSISTVLITLKAERKKAKEEREFAAKHKALLMAVEAVTQFIDYYNTLPDKELPKGGASTKEISEMSIALNRLHFYCSIETIREAIAMSEVLAKAFAEAVKAKMSSMFIGGDINAIEGMIGRLEKNNGGQTSDSYKEIASLYEKKASLIKDKYKAVERCRDVITNDLQKVYGSLGKVLLMARRELNFPINETEYATMLNRSNAEMVEYSRQLFAEIREEVEKKIKDGKAGAKPPLGTP
jgi:hypothetical protein